MPRYEPCFVIIAINLNGLRCTKKAQRSSRNSGCNDTMGHTATHYGKRMQSILTAQLVLFDLIKWSQLRVSATALPKLISGTQPSHCCTVSVERTPKRIHSLERTNVWWESKRVLQYRPMELWDDQGIRRLANSLKAVSVGKLGRWFYGAPFLALCSGETSTCLQMKQCRWIPVVHQKWRVSKS